MHASAEAVSTGASEVIANANIPVEVPVVVEAAVTPEPTPVSPMGYAGLAALFGIAGGIVLAPWLEKMYRREVKHQHAKEDENE
jgi:hypothetical protein